MPQGLVSRVAAVAALAVVVAVAGGCGARSDDANPPREELVTAGPQSGDLLAHGRVTSDGEPLAGAKVVLQVAPAGGVTTPDVERWSAPVVTTDADGLWALKLDPDDIPDDYYPDSYSFLEFQLVFGDGSRLATWSGSVFRRDDPDVWRTEGANPPDPVLVVDVDLATGDVTATDSKGETSRPGSE